MWVRVSSAWKLASLDHCECRLPAYLSLAPCSHALPVRQPAQQPSTLPRLASSISIFVREAASTAAVRVLSSRLLPPPLSVRARCSA
jgi:hypothetical protein